MYDTCCLLLLTFIVIARTVFQTSLLSVDNQQAKHNERHGKHNIFLKCVQRSLSSEDVKLLTIVINSQYNWDTFSFSTSWTLLAAAVDKSVSVNDKEYLEANGRLWLNWSPVGLMLLATTAMQGHSISARTGWGENLSFTIKVIGLATIALAVTSSSD